MYKKTIENIVTSIAKIQNPLQLTSGKVLLQYDLKYETYGNLNKNKDNAVLICHALSGNHHAAGKYQEDDKAGWWDNMIGPEKPIDTNKQFVVCLNNLGGCHGTTGPTSINPDTNKVYGSDFPIVTVTDWVNSQKELMNYLGIPYWQFVVGGSLGGMQSFEWTLQFPQLVKNCIIIAAAPKLTAQNIAFNEIARQAIMKDPNWHDGNYIEKGVFPALSLIHI